MSEGLRRRGCLVLWALILACQWAVSWADEAGVVRERAMVENPEGGLFEVALQGGVKDSASALRGARIVVRDQAGRVLWDEFDRGLHPWLVRAGRFAGKPVVLIGVRKTAIFDPIEARRPFIYALRGGGEGLRKVWLGTSLSRPFVTADFGNLDGRGEDELVALERTRSGGLSLGAYRWRGFGVEGIGRSRELEGAFEVRCADVWGDSAEEVVVQRAWEEQWQFESFALHGEQLISCCELWATVGTRPAEWELLERDATQPGGVRLSRGDVWRVLRFRAKTAGE